MREIRSRNILHKLMAIILAATFVVSAADTQMLSDLITTAYAKETGWGQTNPESADPKSKEGLTGGHSFTNMETGTADADVTQQGMYFYQDSRNFYLMYTNKKAENEHFYRTVGFNIHTAETNDLGSSGQKRINFKLPNSYPGEDGSSQTSLPSNYKLSDNTGFKIEYGGPGSSSINSNTHSVSLGNVGGMPLTTTCFHFSKDQVRRAFDNGLLDTLGDHAYLSAIQDGHIKSNFGFNFTSTRAYFGFKPVIAKYAANYSNAISALNAAGLKDQYLTGNSVDEESSYMTAEDNKRFVANLQVDDIVDPIQSYSVKDSHNTGHTPDDPCDDRSDSDELFTNNITSGTFGGYVVADATPMVTSRTPVRAPNSGTPEYVQPSTPLEIYPYYPMKIPGNNTPEIPVLSPTPIKADTNIKVTYTGDAMQDILGLKAVFTRGKANTLAAGTAYQYLNTGNKALSRTLVVDNKILFAKVRDEAIIPSKELYNAGYDIYPCFSEPYICIQPHGTVFVPTGIASALPESFYFQIQERGSSGSKGIKYSAGVIDSSYRGEWFLATTNTNNKPVIILKNSGKFDKEFMTILEDVAIVYPYEKALFQAVVHNVHNELIIKSISYEELKQIDSERGDGRLGSSGK